MSELASPCPEQGSAAHNTSGERRRVGPVSGLPSSTEGAQ